MNECQIALFQSNTLQYQTVHDGMLTGGVYFLPETKSKVNSIVMYIDYTMTKVWSSLSTFFGNGHRSRTFALKTENVQNFIHCPVGNLPFSSQ